MSREPDDHGNPMAWAAVLLAAAAGCSSIRPDTPCAIGFSRDGIDFDARANNNRAGLLLSGDTLYIAWGSHGDKHSDMYHGWVASYDAATLNLQNVFDAGPRGQCGIWQSGMGLAADDRGSIYFTTGNAPDGAGFPKYGNCVVKLGADLRPLDYFAPVDQYAGHEATTPDPLRFVLYGTPLYPQDYIATETAQPAGIDTHQPGMFGGPSYFRDDQGIAGPVLYRAAWSHWQSSTRWSPSG